jgi:acetyl-CoA acetyltransferase
MHAADLSAVVLNELVGRAGVDPQMVDVISECVSQVGDQSSNIGRFSVLAAGWPERIPGATINRARGSSQQALDVGRGTSVETLAKLMCEGGGTANATVVELVARPGER